ncbi:transcriptional adapter 1-like [Pollicipes pollicipes]|uniref:transcriptional adapter 1-like n=1 Tax=Pollicipes pollicipes TaxID=41117 RepID=UPI00188567A1|nr:transcriptional adapter 1-like [Pollicipes pollicipes]
MDDLNKARHELEAGLGEEGTKQYFTNLKLWFKVKISKEEFDAKSRTLLPVHQVHLHNNFLLALLNKCHLGDVPSEESGASSQLRDKVAMIKSQTRAPAAKKRRKRPPSPFSHRYEPAEPAQWVGSPTRATPPPPPIGPGNILEAIQAIAMRRTGMVPCDM